MSADNRFTLNVMTISYYSGKLECYFRYKEIPYNRNEVTWSFLVDEVYPNAGTMEVPTVYDGKNSKWLRDSTSIMEYIENDEEIKKKANFIPVLPPNKIEQFICYLLEDFFDEWLWRTALYYRWNFDIDANLMSNTIVSYLHADKWKLERFILTQITKYRQKVTYITNDGIIGIEQKKYIESQYLEILLILDNIFAKRKYLFSNTYPSFADFGLFASMFRHFSLDPTPRKIMIENAPNVYQWVATMWNSKQSQCRMYRNGDKYNGDIIKSLYPLLTYFVRNYLEYLYLNEKAYIEKKSNFDVTVNTPKIKQCVLKNLYIVPFRVWCRRKLQERYKKLMLSKEEEGVIQSILMECGCWNVLWRDSGFNKLNADKINEEFNILPYCRKPEKWGTMQKFGVWLNGSPKWDDQFIKYRLVPIGLLTLGCISAAGAGSVYFIKSKL